MKNKWKAFVVWSGHPDVAHGSCSPRINSPHILLFGLPRTTEIEHMLFSGNGSHKAQYLFSVPIKGAVSQQRQQVHSALWDRLLPFLNAIFIWHQCKKSVAVYHDVPFSHCSTWLFFRRSLAPVPRPVLHSHTYWNLIWYHWLIAQVWPPRLFYDWRFLWDHCGPSSSERSDSPTAAVRMNGSFPRRGMMKRIQFL